MGLKHDAVLSVGGKRERPIVQISLFLVNSQSNEFVNESNRNH